MIKVSSASEDKRVEVILRLRRYRSKVGEYQACKELYDSLYPSGVQVLSDMPMHRSDVFEPERWADRRINQAERMQRSLDAMREALDDVAKLTDLVDGDLRTVLILRYMLNKSWEQIAEQMHVARITGIRWHDKAIALIVKHDTNGDVKI